jgi:hypothetical protein
MVESDEDGDPESLVVLVATDTWRTSLGGGAWWYVNPLGAIAGLGTTVCSAVSSDRRRYSGVRAVCTCLSLCADNSETVELDSAEASDEVLETVGRSRSAGDRGARSAGAV